MCGPSRAGLMTGRYQTHFGHEFNSPIKEGVGLPLSEKTLGNRMKTLGYRTGIVGKWHLGGGGKGLGEAYHPLNRGFDEFYGFFGSMVHFYRSDHIWRGWEKIREKEYLTDAIARESCGFIERNCKRPFFLYVPFNAVHTPLEAPQADLDAVSALDVSAFKNKEKATARMAMLRSLDRAIGRIMQSLKDNGIYENTLVFLVNDNGDYTKNGPFRGGKGRVTEGGVRVPFVVKWPDCLPAGQTYDHPVITLDVMSTMIAAAGREIAPAWKLSGVNLLPYLSGKNNQMPHEWLFWRIGNERAARNGKWKIYYNGGSGYGGSTRPEDRRWTLYDLCADPGERADLKKKEPEVFERMLKRYEKWNALNCEPLWPFGASGQMGRWS
jgi:arylsulfatase A-like enzyme